MICKQCGAECVEGSKFCPICGSKFEEEVKVNSAETVVPEAPVMPEAPVVPPVYANPTPVAPTTPVRKEFKFPFDIKKVAIWAASAVAAIILVIILINVFTPKSEKSVVCYYKNSNLYVMQAGKTDGKRVGKHIEEAYFTQDAKRVYYIDDNDNLVYASLSKPEKATVIDDDVVNFALVNDEDLLIYEKDNGAVYASTKVTKEGFKLLGSDVSDYAFSSDFKTVAYIDEGNLYTKKVKEDADREEIAEYPGEIISYYENGAYIYGENIYYMDDGVLSVWDGKEAKIVAENASYARIVDGENLFYYTTEYEDSDYYYYSDPTYSLYMLNDKNEAVEILTGVDEIDFYDMVAIIYGEETETSIVITSDGNTYSVEGAYSIYFSEDGKTIYTVEDGMVCEYKINGKELGERKEIMEGYDVLVTDDGIIIRHDENTDTYSVSYYDGKKAELITDECYYAYNFDGKTLYYTDEDDDLYKQKPGKEKKLVAENVYEVAIDESGKNCYYIADWDPYDYEGTLYKEGKKKPIETKVSEIDIVENGYYD